MVSRLSQDGAAHPKSDMNFCFVVILSLCPCLHPILSPYFSSSARPDLEVLIMALAAFVAHLFRIVQSEDVS